MPNIIDTVISAISPAAGLRRAAGRRALGMLSNIKGSASDASYTGATKTKRSLRNWGLRSGTPDEEIIPELAALRSRSRDLFRDNEVAAGAIKRMVTNIVGPGLTVQSQLDRDVLGMDEQEAEAWETKAERLFRMWAASKEADASMRMNFYDLQRLGIQSFFLSGEVVTLLPLIQRQRSISSLRVQLIEGDRLCNPDDKMDTDELAGGIEVGSYGEPKAYWIRTSSPFSLKSPLWKRVQAFGSNTGRPNVLHVYWQDRPEQRRGVPFLSPIIEPLKQLGQFRESVLTAAVIQSFFTVFLKTSKKDEPLSSLFNGPESGEDPNRVPPNYELGPGAVLAVDPADGEDVVFANPPQPSTNFDEFFMAMIKLIGMGLNIPFEVLLNSYNSSYSASKAALQEFWKVVVMFRAHFVSNFCQPIYEEFLADMVASGKLEAPGFFENEMVRRAYCGSKWHGRPQGSLDPLKEAKAYEILSANAWKTDAEITAEVSGGDWLQNTIQRGKEIRMKKQHGVISEQPVAAAFGDSGEDPQNPEE